MTTAQVTEQQWQQLARDECGQPDQGDEGVVAAYAALDKNFPLYWAMYADKRPLGGLRLQYLWCKRHALEFLVGQLWQRVNYQDADVNESLSDLIEHLQGLQSSVESQITMAQTRSAGVRGPAIGAIQTTAPIEPCPGEPDPNARRYRGDPLKGSPFYPLT